MLASRISGHGPCPSPSNVRNSRTSSIASSRHQQSIMPASFGGLIRKFSRKSSDLSSEGNNVQPASKGSSRGRFAPSQASQNSNPFMQSAPATRRPDRPGMNAFTTPSDEPPPAYSPTDPAISDRAATLQATSSAPRVEDNGGNDDAFAFLKEFDTVFVVDDSGSMAGHRWRQTRKALETIAPICTQYDQDGIDIYFLNFRPKNLSFSDRTALQSETNDDHFQNIKDADKVRAIFEKVRPSGTTPTGTRLEKLLKGYLGDLRRGKDLKPMNIIVITDGEPSDDVESVLIHAARKLDEMDAPAKQVGIQFFQVGNDPGAREHLKELDDGLKELSGNPNLRDIVDTVPFTGENGGELTGRGILKVVLGSVNKRLDRKSADLHRR